MIKAAITGNIASGKSTVQNIIQDYGYKVIDTDIISKKYLTVKNKSLYETFKDYDVFENGEFSRYKVGQLIFSDEYARKKIAEIMHPQIKDDMLRFFKENEKEKMAFVGIPLLFEANMQDLFDKVIFVYANDDIRLERLIKRNNYTIEHAKDRMNSQQSQDAKIELSDYIICNNNSIEDLQDKVKKVLDELSS